MSSIHDHADTIFLFPRNPPLGKVQLTILKRRSQQPDYPFYYDPDVRFIEYQESPIPGVRSDEAGNVHRSD